MTKSLISPHDPRHNLDMVTVGEAMAMFVAEDYGDLAEVVRFTKRIAGAELKLPHIGSATHETRYCMAACTVDNLIAALTGTVTQNGFNLHQLLPREKV